MRYNIELILFDIRQKKILYLLPLVFIWFIFLPFMLSQAQNIILTEGNYNVYFGFLQKILPIFLFYYLYLFFKNILDNEAIETIYATNSNYKMIYVYFIFILYQLIIIPFYIISFYYFEYTVSLSETMNIIFILFFLASLFYCLSYLFLSPLVAIGILFIYCFIFILIIPEFSLLNVFHIGQSMFNIEMTYYYKHIIEIIVMLTIGLRKEKRIIL